MVYSFVCFGVHLSFWNLNERWCFLFFTCVAFLLVGNSLDLWPLPFLSFVLFCFIWRGMSLGLDQMLLVLFYSPFSALKPPNPQTPPPDFILIVFFLSNKCFWTSAYLSSWVNFFCINKDDLFRSSFFSFFVRLIFISHF